MKTTKQREPGFMVWAGEGFQITLGEWLHHIGDVWGESPHEF